MDSYVSGDWWWVDAGFQSLSYGDYNDGFLHWNAQFPPDFVECRQVCPESPSRIEEPPPCSILLHSNQFFLRVWDYRFHSAWVISHPLCRMGKHTVAKSHTDPVSWIYGDLGENSKCGFSYLSQIISDNSTRTILKTEVNFFLLFCYS